MPNYSQAQVKEKQYLVQEEVRVTAEEIHTSMVAGMRLQGAWLRWAGVTEQRLTWSDIWQAELQRMKFLIQPVYDVLPRPSETSSSGARLILLPAPSAKKKGNLNFWLLGMAATAGGMTRDLLTLPAVSHVWQERLPYM